MTPEEMIARDGIRHTLGLYTSAIDRGAYHELVKVYATNIRFMVSDSVSMQGRDDVIAGQRAGAKQRGAFEPGNFQRHSLGNPMIKITGSNSANSVTYFQVMSELGLDHSGVYIDAFVCEHAHWWIAKRRVNVEWMLPASRFSAFTGKPQVSTTELDIGLFEG